MKTRINGFTLFELLVSISIIGILTAVATISFSNAQRKARDARRVEDMKNIQNAAEMYYSQNNYLYPPTYTAGTNWTVGGQVILQSFPSDPKPDANYTNGYRCAGSSTAGYCCCVNLENATAGNYTDMNCGTAGAGRYFCIRNQQ